MTTKRKVKEKMPTSKKLKNEILDYVVETIPCVTNLPRILDNTPIEFRIASRNGWFIDTNNLFHVVKIRIEKRNAAGNFAAIPNGDPMSPYCGLLWTLFKDVEVSMNHSLVWSSNQSYQTIAYINMLLNAPKEHKETIMTAGLWYEDVPGALNIVGGALDDAVSSNQKHRAAIVDGGNNVTLKGKVFCDVLNVQSSLLDGVTIDLRFTPHAPEFCLSATANTRYRIVLVDSYIMCGRKQMKNTSVARMIYDYTHHKMLRFTHQRDLADFGPVVLAEGPNLPYKVIVGLQSESAFSGSYTKNRLGFYPSGVTNVTILVNDVHKPHKLGYIMEYTDENPVLTNYTDSYVGLFQELGLSVPTITQNQFKDGFTLWAFDISKGHFTEEKEIGPTNQGNCSLKMKFRKEMLLENVVVYCLLMYHKSFELPNDGFMPAEEALPVGIGTPHLVDGGLLIDLHGGDSLLQAPAAGPEGAVGPEAAVSAVVVDLPNDGFMPAEEALPVGIGAPHLVDGGLLIDLHGGDSLLQAPAVGPEAAVGQEAAVVAVGQEAAVGAVVVNLLGGDGLLQAPAVGPEAAVVAVGQEAAVVAVGQEAAVGAVVVNLLGGDGLLQAPAVGPEAAVVAVGQEAAVVAVGQEVAVGAVVVNKCRFCNDGNRYCGIPMDPLDRYGLMTLGRPLNCDGFHPVRPDKKPYHVDQVVAHQVVESDDDVDSYYSDEIPDGAFDRHYEEIGEAMGYSEGHWNDGYYCP